MRLLIFVGMLTLMVAGCQREQGSGLWNLKLGGEAKLVSSDGSDVKLESLSGGAVGKSSRRSTKTAKADEVKLPAGTIVLVHAIDGDDARVEIKEGPKAGSFYWVECSRLEAATK